MRFVLAFFCLSGTTLIQGTSAQLEQDLPKTDLFSDSFPCLGPKIQGLIYTHETHLLKNPAIKTGCDVRYEGPTMFVYGTTGYRFHNYPSRVLRYYVRDDDADGQDLDISPGGFVLLSNGNTSATDSGKSRFSFHHICFPTHCYTEEFVHLSGYKYCQRSGHKWSIEKIDVEFLGRTAAQSMVYIKCEQKGTTIPITTPSLPAGPSERLLEYDQSEFLEPHLRFEYQMLQDRSSPYWVKCILRKPLLDPNTILRTFFYGIGGVFYEWKTSHIISAAQVMALQNGNATNGPDTLPAAVSCFPHQCLMTTKTTCDFQYLNYVVALHRGNSQLETLAFENYSKTRCSKTLVYTKRTSERTETTVIDEPDRQQCLDT